MNKVIEKITKLRDERNWTNYHLSIEAGICPPTILNWYKRNAMPKIEAIQSICNAFGISLCEFFNFDNERISLSETQSAFLLEYDKLTKDEKVSLLNFVETMNSTREKFLTRH